MPRLLLPIIALLLHAACHAQNTADEPPAARDRLYLGYSIIDDPETGQPMMLYHLHPITVYPPLKFKNKKEEDFYWRTVRNVKVTLPYAKLIRETLLETYEYIETLPTEKERRQYMKQMEKEVFKEYKPILKKLSRNQARLLVKLVQRETSQSSYNILKAFLGGFRATFWQGFGRLFGVNLKSDFNPAGNNEDQIINRVATLVEEGRL